MSPASKLSPGRHAFPTSSGATLSYYVTGHGSPVIVNVAPGWGPSSLLYQHCFTYLEDSFTFIHLEVRGTRDSSFPADLEEMSSWHMAQDVESLRLYLELEAIDHLTGHSNGGCIALWYAIRFPNRVHKLLLLDAQLLGAGHISAPAMAAVLDARPEKDKDAVAAFRGWRPRELKTDEEMAESLNAFLPLYLAKPERDLAAFEAGFTNLPQAACITSQYAAEGQHEDQIDHLGEVFAETLIIVGRHDFICPVPVSEAIAAGIRNSTLEVLEDCGHMPFIEKKEKFAEILKKLCSTYDVVP